MKCPSCGETLAITDRQGIEIDYCPSCRGVWLDRGELDKIIERSEREFAPAARVEERDGRRDYDRDRRDYDDDRRYRGEREHEGYGRPPHRKRRGLLGELFDFD
ncbi:MAG TPA: zf-TFIIB domain-containing protein [Chloroflexota bacterium]|nr:zf-TFIIB domain-containing protein [Chloroflexota bacterium]